MRCELCNDLAVDQCDSCGAWICQNCNCGCEPPDDESEPRERRQRDEEKSSARAEGR